MDYSVGIIVCST